MSLAFVEPTLYVLLWILGALLAIHGFRKKPKDRFAGFLGLAVVVLSSLKLGIEIHGWLEQQPRTISLSTGDVMVEKLKEYSGQRVHFSYVQNDNEAFEFAQQVQAVLRDAAWIIQAESRRVGGAGSPVGVNLWLLTSEPSEAALALEESLRDAGFKVTMGPSPIPPPGEVDSHLIWIMVGEKSD